MNVRRPLHRYILAPSQHCDLVFDPLGTRHSTADVPTIALSPPRSLAPRAVWAWASPRLSEQLAAHYAYVCAQGDDNDMVHYLYAMWYELAATLEDSKVRYLSIVEGKALPFGRL
jgi:hypothetical protein